MNKLVVVILLLALCILIGFPSNKNLKDNNLNIQFQTEDIALGDQITVPMDALTEAFGLNICSPDVIKKLRSKKNYRIVKKGIAFFNRRFNKYQVESDFKDLAMFLFQGEGNVLTGFNEKDFCIIPHSFPSSHLIEQDNPNMLTEVKLGSDLLYCLKQNPASSGKFIQPNDFYPFTDNINSYLTELDSSKTIEQLQAKIKRLRNSLKTVVPGTRKHRVLQKRLRSSIIERNSLKLFKKHAQSILSVFQEVCQLATKEAASPSPSMIPNPSVSPDILPSPSVSAKPSASASASPSESPKASASMNPSQSPSKSPSAIPSGSLPMSVYHFPFNSDLDDLNGAITENCFSHCPAIDQTVGFARFDGSDFLDIRFDSDKTITGGELTISYWVRAAGGGNQIVIANPFQDGSHSSPHFEWSAVLMKSNQPSMYIDGGPHNNSGNAIARINTWTHVTSVYGSNEIGSFVKHYINGELEHTVSLSKAIRNRNRSPIRIGANGLKSENFNGDLKDLRVYAKQLTKNQVKTIMELGRPDIVIPSPSLKPSSSPQSPSPSASARPSFPPGVCDSLSGICHFVDSQASGDNNGTSWNDAWNSIQSINGVNAGDTVYISGGPAGSSKTYNVGNTWTPISGADGKPITYKIGQTQGHNGSAIFNSTSHWIGGRFKNIIVSGDAGDGAMHFKLNNIGGHAFHADSSPIYNVRLSYIDFGKRIFGIRLRNVHDIEIDNTYMYKLDGGPTSTTRASDYWIYVENRVTEWDNTKIHHNKLDIEAGLIHDPSKTICGHEACGGFGEDGIKGDAYGLSIYNNTINTIIVESIQTPQHADLIQVLHGKKSKIYNNTFINSTQYPIFLLGYWGSFEDIYVFNNKMIIDNRLIPLSAPPAGMAIGSETWRNRDPSTGVRLENKRIIVANNLIADLRGHPAIAMSKNSPHREAPFIESVATNNIAVNFTNAHPFGLDPAIQHFGTNTSISAVDAPNHFINYTPYNLSSDYHINSSDTRLIDQGHNLSSYCSNVPELCLDLDGNKRPTSGPWDIGPYEYKELIPDTIEAILPIKRVIDWSRAGRTSVIPEVPVTANVKDFNAVGDGVSNDTQAFRNAIAAATPGTAVYVPEGTYRITGTIFINKSVVLRGAGTDKTTINGTGYIYVIPSNLGGAVRNIASWLDGFDKGETKIQLNRGDHLSKGEIIWLDQTNDTSVVNHTGQEGFQLAGRLGTDFYNHGRDRATFQLNRILDIQEITVGSQTRHEVTLEDPLFKDYSLNQSPEVFSWGRKMVRNVGFEDFKMVGHPNHEVAPSYLLRVQFCEECWLDNVEIVRAETAAVNLEYNYKSQVRNSVFHTAQRIGSSSYGVLMYGSSYPLIENNVFDGLVASVMVGASNHGAVIGYNHIINNAPGSGWLYGSINTHAVGNEFNLIEGNYTPQIGFDVIHGSAWAQTAYRNRSLGYEEGKTGQLSAMIIQAWNRDMNVVGNVFGVDGIHGNYEKTVIGDTSGTGKSIYRLGHWIRADRNPGFDDPVTVQSLIRHGNFDFATDSIKNPSPAPLPDSLYYSERPAWWPPSVAWPPIGPDVQCTKEQILADLCNVECTNQQIQNDTCRAHAYKLPAQLRYEAR